MPEFLQNIDSSTLILIAGGCGLLCVVLVVVSTVLQIFGNVLEIVTGLFGFVFGFAGNIPGGGCGCIVILLGCGVCGGLGVGLSNFLQTCGTPEAVNFCRLLGR